MLKIVLWVLGILVALQIVAVFAVFVVANVFNSPKRRGAKPVDAGKSDQFYVKDNAVVFVLGGNFFSIGEKPIPGAEPASFEVLDREFARDKNRVYYGAKPVEGLSPEGVEPLPPYRQKRLGKVKASSCFIKNSERVYFATQMLKGADPSTFKPLWGEYALDKNAVYYFNRIRIPVTGEVKPLAEHAQYLVMGNDVYYCGECIGADGASFHLLDAHYGVDDNRVYYDGSPISGVDAPSFKLLNNLYTSDCRHVYFSGTTIAGADPASFKILLDEFAKDAHHVFYRTSQIAGAPAAKWTPRIAKQHQARQNFLPLELNEQQVIFVPSREVVELASFISAFRGNVFMGGQWIEGVKPEAVVPLDESGMYVQINDVVYYGTAPLRKANAEHFKVLTGAFSCDQNTVFWHQFPVAGVQPSEFHYQQGMYATETDTGDYVLVSAIDEGFGRF